MAERFGGRYSPGRPRPGEGSAAPEAVREALREESRPDPVGARANLMWVPPAVAALAGLLGGPGALLLSLGGAAALAFGAWLLREGLRAEDAFRHRPAARRPAAPRKILAAAAAGLGAGLLAAAGGWGLGGALYGVAAAALHLAAFGLDPLRDKLPGGADPFQADRVARVATEAEGHVAAMEAAAAGFDPALEARVGGFAALARRMIRTVEEDPRDLAGARRWLVVYLLGARDATARYAEVARRAPDPAARASYEALLADLEANFAGATAKMLEGGRETMDIEIKVLRDRLAREGLGDGNG